MPEIMNRELISVIVPVYNVENYLERCIRSLVDQRYVNLEIILVNDGSTDSSKLICDKWKENDSRIIVINKENGGLVSARKTGLKAASGTYIGFVDSDDYISEVMYHNLYECVCNNNVDFAYCGMRIVYENGEIYSDLIPELEGVYQIGNKVTTGVNFINNYVFQTDRKKQMYTGGMPLGLYKSDFIKKAYSHVPDNCSQGEDLICLIWMILNGNNFYFLPELCYNYLIRRSSISHNYTPLKYIESCRMMSKIIEICNEAGVYEALKECIEAYLNKIIILDADRLNPTLNCELFYYPNEKSLVGKKIVIYGAGKVGKCFRQQFMRNNAIDIVAWVDSNYSSLGDERVESPYVLKDLDFDKLVIAIDNDITAKKIQESLINMGFSTEKIVYVSPSMKV